MVVNATSTGQQTQTLEWSITHAPVRVGQPALEPTHRAGTHAGQQDTGRVSARQRRTNPPPPPRTKRGLSISPANENGVLNDKMLFEARERYCSRRRFSE